MKKTLLFVILLGCLHLAMSQSDKMVQWSYRSKKIGDKTFEVHMTANISGDYHLYAQDPGGEGPIGTTFTFVKTPLLILDGKVKESGNLTTKYETAWGHDVKYYLKTVDFVQIVKIKGNAKTNLSGRVEFMVCNEKQCLPPGHAEIKVSVGG